MAHVFSDMTRTFGDAIEDLKKGRRVSRAGWNGKGMFLFLLHPNSQDPNEPNGYAVDLPQSVSDLWDCPQLPVIVMRTAQGTLAIGWLASQADMLAEDWFTLPETS